jgi:predicted MPP superfamily phosphohydrolase
MPRLLAISGPFPIDAVLLLFLIAAIPVASGLVVSAFLFRISARKLWKCSLSPESWIERKRLVRSSFTILALYALALFYGVFVERRWVELTKTEIRVREPLLGQDRFRIVHLSDFHLRRFGATERRVAELVREAKPDLILITGDYGNSGRTPAALAELLRDLKTPYGCFGVTGNNDFIFANRKLLGSAGVILLENETRLIGEGGRGIQLVGQDYWKPSSLNSILGAEKKPAYTIFLHHKPEAVDELRHLQQGQQIDLILCGHTHGGQVCLPFWGAIFTESKYHKKYERGLYDVDGVPMYVNRGTGWVILPVRFLARPEVAIIDLVYR